jgi:hypothetical protein
MIRGDVVELDACCYCRQPISPILLPVPMRLYIKTHPEGSPTALYSLLVACPACRRVSSYLTEQFRALQRPQKAGSSDQDVAKRAVRVARLCGVDNCGVPITIHTVVASGTRLSEVLAETAPKWQFDASCRCGSGRQAHSLRDGPPGPYIVEGIGIPPEPSCTIP